MKNEPRQDSPAAKPDRDSEAQLSRERFTAAAVELECDMPEEAFAATLKALVQAKPTSNDEIKKRVKKTAPKDNK